MSNKTKLGVVIGTFQNSIVSDEDMKLISTAINNCSEVIIVIQHGIVRSALNPLKIDDVILTVKDSVSKYEDLVKIVTIRKDKGNGIYEIDLLKICKDFNESDTVFYFSNNNAEDYTEFTRDNYRFREGYIAATKEEFNAHYSVVDAILTDGVHVLLGRKETGWCLIGGFADEEDNSLEDAIVRELEEETGIRVVRKPQYLMSHQCNDRRYVGARQPFSTVFVIPSTIEQMNLAVGNDDIEDTKVVLLSDIEKYLKPNDSHLMYVKHYLKAR